MWNRCTREGRNGNRKTPARGATRRSSVVLERDIPENAVIIGVSVKVDCRIYECSGPYWLVVVAAPSLVDRVKILGADLMAVIIVVAKFASVQAQAAS